MRDKHRNRNAPPQRRPAALAQSRRVVGQFVRPVVRSIRVVSSSDCYHVRLLCCRCECLRFWSSLFVRTFGQRKPRSQNGNKIRLHATRSKRRTIGRRAEDEPNNETQRRNSTRALAKADVAMRRQHHNRCAVRSRRFVVAPIVCSFVCLNREKKTVIKGDKKVDSGSYFLCRPIICRFVVCKKKVA